MSPSSSPDQALIWDRGAAIMGVRAALPYLPTIAPFGVLTALSAVDAGYGPWQVMASAAFVFAGAAQIAASTLLDEGALWAVAVATAWVINLRMSMYAAALAPQFMGAGLGPRMLVAFSLTDQSFLICHQDHRLRPQRPMGQRLSLALGAAFSIWLLWLATNALGLAVSDIDQVAVVLARIPLDFAIPLVFLAVLIPNVRDRPSLLAALVGGTVASVGLLLPLKLGILAGALAGVIAGLVAEMLLGRRRNGAVVLDDGSPVP